MRGPGHIAGIGANPGALAIKHRHRLLLPFADGLGDLQRLGILGDAGLAVGFPVQLKQLVGPLLLEMLRGENLQKPGAIEVGRKAAEQLPAQRDILRVDRAAVAEKRQVDADELGLERQPERGCGFLRR